MFKILCFDEDNLQSSNAEHKKYANLLLHAQMQFPDLCDRKRQGDEVHEYGMCGVRERKSVVIDALSDVFPIPLLPCEADRRTNKRGGETERYHRRNLEVDDGPYDLPETLLWEDLKEEEQEGDLDKPEGAEICDLADPKVL